MQRVSGMTRSRLYHWPLSLTSAVRLVAGVPCFANTPQASELGAVRCDGRAPLSSPPPSPCRAMSMMAYGSTQAYWRSPSRLSVSPAFRTTAMGRYTARRGSRGVTSQQLVCSQLRPGRAKRLSRYLVHRLPRGARQAAMGAPQRLRPISP